MYFQGSIVKKIELLEVKCEAENLENVILHLVAIGRPIKLTLNFFLNYFRIIIGLRRSLMFCGGGGGIPVLDHNAVNWH